MSKSLEQHCDVHYYNEADGVCSCLFTCKHCKTKYKGVAGHLHEDCIAALKSRVKAGELLIHGLEAKNSKLLGLLAALNARAEEVEQEIHKLDEEVQCALGANGILFHTMRRLGLECEDLEPPKWYNARAEAAEARLAILDAQDVRLPNMDVQNDDVLRALAYIRSIPEYEEEAKVRVRLQNMYSRVKARERQLLDALRAVKALKEIML